MDKVWEKILTGLLTVVAFLPLRVLYILSDIVWCVLYYAVRYRRKVVMQNLTASFPEKEVEELNIISRKFYRSFCDYIFETVKLLHISDNEMTRRMTFSGLEYMDRAVAEGHDVVVYFSHLFNWEWAPSVKLHSRFKDDDSVVFGQIYRPLRNVIIDKVMLKIRGRFDTESIAKAQTLRKLLRYRKEGRRFVIGFMSDQKPSHGDPERVLSFMGRPTAVITGTETLARRLDATVVYWKMTSKGRGYYHIEVIPMAEHASATAEGFLTKKYFELLEENIRETPHLWLWSHKRWKTSPSSWRQVNPDTLIK
ncbi:MAG: lysophospholipid acyltransferase family protein [Muribaculaceae bacterium]|nr:lysophospholipid acyltransferase family protein [Muribaculaceae bacterium]